MCATKNIVKIGKQFSNNRLNFTKMAIHKILLKGAVEWLTVELLNGAHIVLTEKEHEINFEAAQSQSTGSRLIVAHDRIVIEFNTGGVQPVAFTLALFVEVADTQQQIDLTVDASHEFAISSDVDQLTITSGLNKSLRLSNGSTSSATHVITEDTVWYNHPAQATPPNGELKAGTRVNVLSPASSFTRMRTEDGSVTGYVSSDVLAPIAVNPGDDEEAFDELEGQEISALTACTDNPPPWDNELWRTADCLKQLLAQVNTLSPNRNKASDGSIGDIAHQNRTSDHNPHILGADGKGIVTAMDITHDPQGKCDCNALASALQINKDSRIKYVIWNKRIMNSATISGTAPWTWRPYTGENPHNKHIHISVNCDPASYDSKTAWNISVADTF